MKDHLTKVKIKSDGSTAFTSYVYLDDVELVGVVSAKLTIDANNPINKCELEFIPEEVLFEGETEVYATINGRRYKLVGDEKA